MGSSAVDVSTSVIEYVIGFFGKVDAFLNSTQVLLRDRNPIRNNARAWYENIMAGDERYSISVLNPLSFPERSNSPRWALQISMNDILSLKKELVRAPPASTPNHN